MRPTTRYEAAIQNDHLLLKVWDHTLPVNPSGNTREDCIPVKQRMIVKREALKRPI
jgi:hypothetical protein